MTPVRPVGTSSATLPRHRRPTGRRGPSFAQYFEQEAAADQTPSAAPLAVAPTLFDLGDDVASASVDAVTAARAFGRADEQATGFARHPGRFIDLMV